MTYIERVLLEKAAYERLTVASEDVACEIFEKVRRMNT